MAGEVLRCQYTDCGQFYEVIRVRPDICPYCQRPACWYLVTNPSDLHRALTIDPHLYILSKDDWTFLWGCRIDPEISYDEAQ